MRRRSRCQALRRRGGLQFRSDLQFRGPRKLSGVLGRSSELLGKRGKGYLRIGRRGDCRYRGAGLILRYGDIETNCSVKAVISSLRADTERSRKGAVLMKVPILFRLRRSHAHPKVSYRITTAFQRLPGLRIGGCALRFRQIAFPQDAMPQDGLTLDALCDAYLSAAVKLMRSLLARARAVRRLLYKLRCRKSQALHKARITDAPRSALFPFGTVSADGAYSAAEKNSLSFFPREYGRGLKSACRLCLDRRNKGR